MIPGRQQGVTLVEMVLSIVIFGVLAVGTTAFIRLSADSYASSSARLELAGAARIAVERINRELRNALPNSVRILNGGTCVEFLPVVGAGVHQWQTGSYSGGETMRPPPVEEDADVFHVLGETLTNLSGAPVYVAIYPLPGVIDTSATGVLRAVATPPLQPLAGVDGVSELQLAAPTRFPRAAPPPYRVYLAGAPVAFCLAGGRLIRHEGYALGDAPSSGAGHPLGRNVSASAADAFVHDPGSLTRHAVVRINLAFTGGDNQSTAISHEVHVLNAP
ncbi:MAG: prepilin-type N-terminal cleavage/methylation domain-containing protein [Aquisalimonadaceae bacterium]